MKCERAASNCDCFFLMLPQVPYPNARTMGIPRRSMGYLAITTGAFSTWCASCTFPAASDAVESRVWKSIVNAVKEENA